MIWCQTPKMFLVEIGIFNLAGDLCIYERCNAEKTTTTSDTFSCPDHIEHVKDQWPKTKTNVINLCLLYKSLKKTI